MISPPSTAMICPVTYVLRSEARYSAVLAISCGCPSLCMLMFLQLLGLLFIGEHGCHICFDESRCDAVYTYAASPELLRSGKRHADNRPSTRCSSPVQGCP